MGSAENPTGVRTFNHEDLAALPAYTAVRVALDQLTKEVAACQERGQAVVLRQEDFLELARDAAASTSFADNCERCENRAIREDLDLDPITYPCAVELDGRGGLVAGYLCPRCGHRWRTSWSLDAPTIL